MPRVPIDYSKTIIYRIVCKYPTITDCYVGATTDFKSRKRQHKSRCNNEKTKMYNANVYTFIREHNGWDNFDMIEIEKYNAKDQQDQARRERYWLETYGATLNTVIPSRTVKEYRNENKEQLSEYLKNYQIINKTILKEQRKNYREINKDKIIEQQKEYIKQQKEKILCECGAICSKAGLNIHKKKQKHIKLMLNIGPNNLCR